MNPMVPGLTGSKMSSSEEVGPQQPRPAGEGAVLGWPFGWFSEALRERVINRTEYEGRGFINQIKLDEYIEETK